MPRAASTITATEIATSRRGPPDHHEADVLEARNNCEDRRRVGIGFGPRRTDIENPDSMGCQMTSCVGGGILLRVELLRSLIQHVTDADRLERVLQRSGLPLNRLDPFLRFFCLLRLARGLDCLGLGLDRRWDYQRIRRCGANRLDDLLVDDVCLNAQHLGPALAQLARYQLVDWPRYSDQSAAIGWR